MRSINTDKAIRDAALDSLAQVFESISEILLDSGVPVYEACQLMRSCAVKCAARRLRNETGKNSKSRVAIATGLSRSEVSRLWTLGRRSSVHRRFSQSAAQRIINSWFDSPGYLSPTGEPALIPVFGPRKSLECLVKQHGGGVPVRAMLDELLRIGAVELLQNQKLKVKTRVTVQKGFTATSLRSIGMRTSDLLNTLANNLSGKQPFFEGSALIHDAHPNSIPLIRREVASRGTSFLGSIDDLLQGIDESATAKELKSSADGFRAGVGVFYFETKPLAAEGNIDPKKSRKNLKRATRPSRIER